MGHLADDVGGGGRHQDQIGFPHQPDMAHLGLVGEREEFAIDLVAGQGCDGQRGYELGAALGENDAEGETPLAPAANDVQRLIGGNAARDDEENPFSGAHANFIPQ